MGCPLARVWHMRKKIDGAPGYRGHRDYFWFALILMAVLIGSATRGIV
jgi:hypothetical protein